MVLYSTPTTLTFQGIATNSGEWTIRAAWPWISYITQMCIICFKVAGDNQEMMCPYRICSEGSAAKTPKKYSHLFPQEPLIVSIVQLVVS